MKRKKSFNKVEHQQNKSINPTREDKLSPLESEFYIKRGYSAEQATKMAQLYSGFDEFEREFALDYLNDQDYLRKSVPIKEVTIDGEVVPVVEINASGETILVNALLYEGNSVHPDEIEIDEEDPVELVKCDDSSETYETIGKSHVLLPKNKK